MRRSKRLAIDKLLRKWPASPELDRLQDRYSVRWRIEDADSKARREAKEEARWAEHCALYD